MGPLSPCMVLPLLFLGFTDVYSSCPWAGMNSSWKFTDTCLEGFVTTRFLLTNILLLAKPKSRQLGLNFSYGAAIVAVR